MKLVFLQRVMEVTTDGADAARQPTDTQYWFITFFQGDRGTAGWPQLSGGRQQRHKQDLNILAGSGSTQLASLCRNSERNRKTKMKTSGWTSKQRGVCSLLEEQPGPLSAWKTEAITIKCWFVDSSCAEGSRSGRFVSRHCSSQMLDGAKEHCVTACVRSASPNEETVWCLENPSHVKKNGRRTISQIPKAADPPC